jgi:hypothetical protein
MQLNTQLLPDETLSELALSCRRPLYLMMLKTSNTVDMSAVPLPMAMLHAGARTVK